MSKRSVFTTVTPLPAGVTRQIVLDFLHDHLEMIDLNPLVKERHPILAPPHAPEDEQHCQWFSLTDKISYFPGVSSDVTYTCAFNDLPTGLQTHCYAPAGLTIRNKWTVGGSLPGEARQPVELGLNAPATGLYLREDVDMRCNVIMSSFVKKTLKKSHATLVERLKIIAQMASSGSNRMGGWSSVMGAPAAAAHMAPGSDGGQPYQLLSAFAPPGRVASAASSVSAVSSASSNSTQRSSMWPSAVSSLGTSPASSTTGAPAARDGDTKSQSQSQRAECPAPPKQPFLLLPPGANPPVLPEIVPTGFSIPEPDTPFLYDLQPERPPTNSLVPPALNPQRQQQQKQPDEPRPLKRQRPATQPPVQAYRAPLSGTASTTSSSGIARDSLALPDDKLWRALGGGQPVAVAQSGHARGYNLNPNTNTNTNINLSSNTDALAGNSITNTTTTTHPKPEPTPTLNPSNHGSKPTLVRSHARARSDGNGNGSGHLHRRGYARQRMSLGAGADVPSTVGAGLGVGVGVGIAAGVGVGQAIMRRVRVSMPPSSRAVSLDVSAPGVSGTSASTTWVSTTSVPAPSMMGPGATRGVVAELG